MDDIFSKLRKRYGLPETETPSEQKPSESAPKRRSSYDPLFDKYGKEFGVDPDLLRAMTRQESSFNPRAVSHKNAQGLMQLIPDTAKRFGVKDPFDPDQNIRGGAQYMRWLLDRFKGDVDKALAGYNAGEGAVDKYKGIPPFRETRDYVKKIRSNYRGAGLLGASQPSDNFDTLRSKYGLQGESAPGPDFDALRSKFGLGGDRPTTQPSPTNPVTQTVKTPPALPDQTQTIGGTQKLPVMPESPMTLEAQMTATADMGSSRKATLLTSADQVSLLPKPALRGLKKLVRPEGIIFYNPAKVKNAESMTTAELIGKVDDVADTSQGIALRTERPDGTELSTSIVTSPESAAQQAQVDRSQFPGQIGRQVVTSAQGALQSRDAEYKKWLADNGFVETPENARSFQEAFDIEQQAKADQTDSTAQYGQPQQGVPAQPQAQIRRLTPAEKIQKARERVTQPARAKGGTFTIETPKELKGSARQYYLGAMASQLSQRYNVSYDTAYKYLAGDIGSKRGTVMQLDETEALRLLQSGKPVQLDVFDDAANELKALEGMMVQSRKDQETAKGLRNAEFDQFYNEYIQNGEIPSVAALLVAKDFGEKEVGGVPIDEAIQREREEYKKATDAIQVRPRTAADTRQGIDWKTQAERNQEAQNIRAAQIRDLVQQTLADNGSFTKRAEERRKASEFERDKPMLAAAQRGTELFKGLIENVPQAASAVLRTADIIGEINPLSVQNVAGYVSGREFKASEGQLYQAANEIDGIVERVMPRNKYLDGYRKAGNSIGQMAIQMGLGVATGGVATPLLYGASLGASSQYQEADKAKAGKATRRFAAILGGATAISDALPLQWALKPVTKGGVGRLLSGFFNTVYKEAVPELGEKAAKELVESTFRRLVNRSADVAKKIGAGAKKVGTGAGLEMGQEVFIDKKINDLYASLTYDPGRKVFEINNDDLETAFYAAIGGAAAGGGRILLEQYVAAETEAENAPKPEDVLSDPNADAIDKLIAQTEIKEREAQPTEVQPTGETRAKDAATQPKPSPTTAVPSQPAPMGSQALEADTDAQGTVSDVQVEETDAEKYGNSSSDLGAAIGGMAGSIKASMRDHLWGRVEQGKITDLDSFKNSTPILQVAKTLRDAGQLQTRESFDDFYERWNAEVEPKSGQAKQDAATALINSLTAPSTAQPAASPKTATPPRKRAEKYHDKPVRGMVLEAPLDPQTLTGAKNRLKEVETELQEERRKGTTDAKMGISNERAWQAAVDRIEADPEQEVVSLDINRMKEANDTTSHTGIDKNVLAPIGAAVRKVLKANGIDERNAFRTGGDEVVVAVPKGLGAKIRDEIEKEVGVIEVVAEKDFTNDRTGESFKKGDRIPITISGEVGLTVAEAEKGLGARKRASKDANPVRRVSQNVTTQVASGNKTSQPKQLSIEQTNRLIAKSPTPDPDTFIREVVKQYLPSVVQRGKQEFTPQEFAAKLAARYDTSNPQTNLAYSALMNADPSIRISRTEEGVYVRGRFKGNMPTANITLPAPSQPAAKQTAEPAREDGAKSPSYRKRLTTIRREMKDEFRARRQDGRELPNDLKSAGKRTDKYFEKALDKYVDGMTEPFIRDWHDTIFNKNENDTQQNDAGRDTSGSRAARQTDTQEQRGGDEGSRRDGEASADARTDAGASAATSKGAAVDSVAGERVGDIENFQDFGEKIGGAKKDLIREINAIQDTDLKTQPLSKAFPRPNFAKLIADGVLSFESAKILSFVYDTIPAKPRKSWKLDNWVKKVNQAIDIFKKVFGDNPNAAQAFIDAARKSKLTQLADAFDAYSAWLDVTGFPDKHVSMQGHEIRLFRAGHGGNKTDTDEYLIVHGALIKGRYPTAKAAARALLDKLKTPKKTVFNVYQDTKTKEYFIGKKGAGGVVRLITGLENLKTAREYIEANQTQLDQMWEARKFHQGVERKDTGEEVRTAQDWRNGRDISSTQEFAETFGFRAVEFGNWVKQGASKNERQQAINDSYDALRDLAELLGLDPKALSLNGTLALALGARGGGNASAHYEPLKVVINLTKTKGKGSLGHEWWHALDNHFAKRRGDNVGYVTQSPTVGRVKDSGMYIDDPRLRAELLKAYEGVVKAIRATELPARSRRMDATRATPYWSTIEEMTARAFENYIITRLGEKGHRSDFLANFKDMADWAKGGLDADAFPYPLEAEQDAINAAFDNLFATMEQVNEGDSVILRQVASLDDMFDPATIEAELAKIEPVRDSEGRLLAPNGKVSNLPNERIWKMVRTPAFKAWFGDWINNPANASKVVDENGEPMLMWHGSPTAGFLEFDTSKIGKRSDAKGLHFTNSRSTAASYSGTRDEYIPPTNWKDAGLTVEFNENHNEWTVVDPNGYDLAYAETETEAETQAQALIDEGEFQPENPGNYAGFINLRSPVMDVDVQDGNWSDNIFWNETTQEYFSRDGYYGNVSDLEYNEDEGNYTNEDGDVIWYEAENINDLVDRAREMDDAGVIVRNVNDDGGEMGSNYHSGPSTQAIIFDSRNFKSIHNRGTFSPDDASILRQAAGDASALDDVYNDNGTVNYDKAKDVAERVASGELEIVRLDRQGERGRVAGGSRAIEASILIGADEARRQKASSASLANVVVIEGGSQVGQPLFKLADDESKVYVRKTLPTAHTQEVLRGVESKFTANNELELSEEAGEIVRRLLTHVNPSDKGGAFFGVTLDRATLRKAGNAAQKFADEYENIGYAESEVKALRDLGDNLIKLSKAESYGVAYIFEDALPEEQHHALVMNAGGISPEAITKLKKNPLWKSARLTREYGKLSDLSRAVEIAAKLETGQNKYWDKISPKDKKAFLQTVADDIIDRNTDADGNVTLDPVRYERITKYAENKADNTEGTQRAGAVTDRSDGVDVDARTTDQGTRADAQEAQRPADEGDGDRAAEVSREKGQRVAAFSRILGQEYAYDPQNHDATEAKASQLLSDKGTERAIHEALYGKPSAEGMRVIQWELERLNGLTTAAMKRGDEAEANAYANQAADLAAKIVQRQVATGQEVEINKKLLPLSPEAALLTAQRIVAYSQAPDVQLSGDQTQAIIDLANELADERAKTADAEQQVAKLQRRIKSLETERKERPRATPQKKMLEEYRREKPKLLEDLRNLFPNSPVFSGESEALRMVAGLTPQTETEAFKNWFGDSKVVDADGKPLVVYRGDPQITDKQGLFFTDNADLASDYAGQGTLTPVYLRLENPNIIEANGAFINDLDSDKRVQVIAAKGQSDGTIIRNVIDPPMRWGLRSTTLTPATVYRVNVDSQIKSAIGNSGAFDPNDASILRMAAPLDDAPLDADTIAKLAKYAAGEILEGKSYKTLISELEAITGAEIETVKEIHAMAVDNLRGASRELTETAKERIKRRQEHYREANKLLNASEKPAPRNREIEMSNVTRRAMQDDRYKDDEPLIEAIERLTGAYPKSINDVINDLREIYPDMSMNDVQDLARRAKAATVRLKAEMQKERDEAKGILAEERAKLNEARIAKAKATVKLNKFLTNLATDPNVVKRFNNDMRAKFVSNWGTQIFNAQQAVTLSTPAEMMLDLFEIGLKRVGLRIGETPDVNLEDIMLPYSYIFGNYRQLAESALSEFPDQFYEIHSGLLGDIEIEPLETAGRKSNPVSRALHKWFDKNQVLNDKLAKITGAKLQEMHFRNAIIAATFDQIIRNKSNGTTNLEQAVADGTVRNFITEQDAQFAANKAMRVTFAALIDDKVGRKLKHGYDWLDSYLPIFLNPVVYARFTYTTTKIMVANPILFGMLDSARLGGKGYTTRSLAQGVLAWSGIATAAALMSLFGDDDDDWHTLKFGDTTIDIRRHYPVSSYFYMAHLIRNGVGGKPLFKGNGLTAAGKEVLEGFASLETDYFNYGAGMKFVGTAGDAITGNATAGEVGTATSRLIGNTMAGYLRFFKPMRDVLAQIDNDEAKQRFYQDTAQDEFIKEISRSVPLIARAYNAETAKDARGEDILQPFPAGRIFGINVVHPSYLKPKQSTATAWATKLFRFESSGQPMTAEQRKAFSITRALKNAIRRGDDVEVKKRLQELKRSGELSKDKLDRLEKDLKMSELEAAVKWYFNPRKEKDLRDLRQVWKYATDEEKNGLRKILKSKAGRTREFNQEFGL